MTKARDIADGTRYVDVTGDTMSGGLYTHSAGDTATFNGASTQVFGNALRAATGQSRAAMFVGGDTTGASCWWVDDTSGTQIAVGAVDAVAASAGGGLTLWANNATTWSLGLRVNGGTQAPGSVDLLAQPIISGQMGTAMTSPSSAQKLAFNEFWVSRGISYNSTTRRFTVPVAGIYRITMNPFFNTGASAARVHIGVNNDTPTTTTHYGHTYRESASYDTGCLDSVVSLGAGDYVVFYLAQGQLYNQTTDRFNQFTIAKIA